MSGIPNIAARISTNSTPQCPNLIGLSSDGTRFAYLGNAVLGLSTGGGNQSWEHSRNVVGANSLGPSVTADGRFFVFAATTADTNRQIWLYDFDARTKDLVSRSFEARPGGTGLRLSRYLRQMDGSVVFGAWEQLGIEHR